MLANGKELIAILPSRPICLVKRSGIYLMRCGHGDDERFARGFRKTWRRLGKDVRRSLTDYWRDPDIVYMGLQLVFPTIEVLDDWSGRNEGEAGVCKLNGHLFRFLAPLVDAMPDDILATLIAHELAHAYRAAVGILVLDPDNPLTAEENGRDELETRQLVHGTWGFDEDALGSWLLWDGDDIMAYHEEQISG
jgi:hypothetical protein